MNHTRRKNRKQGSPIGELGTRVPNLYTGDGVQRDNHGCQERRQLIQALTLAIRSSVPPTTMPGYMATWRIWEHVAESIGCTRHRIRLLLLIYRDAVARANAVDRHEAEWLQKLLHALADPDAERHIKRRLRDKGAA